MYCLPLLRLRTLRLPTKPRHQCRPIRRCSRSQVELLTHNNYQLPLPPFRIKRPLLTMRPPDLNSSSSSQCNCSSVKLHWSWQRPNLLRRSFYTSSCHVSSCGAVPGSVVSLHSSWPVSETALLSSWQPTPYICLQKKIHHHQSP